MRLGRADEVIGQVWPLPLLADGVEKVLSAPTSAGGRGGYRGHTFRAGPDRRAAEYRSRARSDRYPRPAGHGLRDAGAGEWRRLAHFARNGAGAGTLIPLHAHQI
jgi:hypothetical protein